jgi:hypothetical protein
MPGFMPGIHVFADSTGKVGDGREKPGHDGLGNWRGTRLASQQS